jgi:ABC-2 type transport system ATP-binding protein
MAAETRAGSGAAVVRLDGLTKRYGARRGVQALSLEVAPGQVLGFLGPNGAGKSTTIRLMVGLLRPTTGSVEVFGSDPCGDVAVRRRLGYLPGELALFPSLSGRELVGRVARLRGGVEPQDIDRLVDRLHVELDRPIRSLSKGNRQKVGLVLAFMHRPDLLVLDEPSSGLDPLLQREFERLVQERVQDGATVFLSSHDLDVVDRVVDRVAIIREGRLVGVDTVDNLRRRAPRMVELRFNGPVDPTPLLAVDGVRAMDTSATTLRLEVSGRLGPLLEVAVPLGVADLTARPVSLDAVFRSFYENAPRPHDAHAY